MVVLVVVMLVVVVVGTFVIMSTCLKINVNKYETRPTGMFVVFSL